MYALVYRRLAMHRGDPGLKIGRFLGGLVKNTVGRVIPGVSTAVDVASVAARAIRGTGGQPQLPVLRVAGGGTVMPGTGATTLPSGAVVGISPLGTIGVRGPRKKPRMNAGNAKAARRAIRRIKSVRKLLQSIESQLPKRKCGHAPKRRGR